MDWPNYYNTVVSRLLYNSISMAFITPGTIETIRTLKDGSINFNISTQELSSESAVRVMALRNKAIIDALSQKSFSNEANKEIDKVEVELPKKPEKTPSQRLRDVLYHLRQQDNRGKNNHKHHNLFMEGIIQHYKNK